jgi:hypothetical protein
MMTIQLMEQIMTLHAKRYSIISIKPETRIMSKREDVVSVKLAAYYVTFTARILVSTEYPITPPDVLNAISDSVVRARSASSDVG